MPILAANAWHEVTFHPFTHDSWATMFKANPPHISPLLLQQIVHGNPVVIFCPNDGEVACTGGFGVSLDDSVVASAIPLQSVDFESEPYAQRLLAAKGLDGHLYVVTDFVGQNQTLKRYNQEAAADLKAIL
jgi:hypothetical protein